VENNRFERLTRSVSSLLSRRNLAGALGLGGITLSVPADAKKKHKHKHKKKKNLKFNDFGCVDVGGKCRGNDANCCSGICQGKKPKNGQKDKSTCVAHNVAGCQADQDGCTEIGTPCGTSGTCVRTTGKASFCALISGGDCGACTKDSECEALVGVGAACVVCAFVCGLDNACMPAAG
jgi:hypothetical protein